MVGEGGHRVAGDLLSEIVTGGGGRGNDGVAGARSEHRFERPTAAADVGVAHAKADRRPERQMTEHLGAPHRGREGDDDRPAGTKRGRPIRTQRATTLKSPYVGRTPSLKVGPLPRSSNEAGTTRWSGAPSRQRSPRKQSDHATEWIGGPVALPPRPPP